MNDKFHCKIKLCCPNDLEHELSKMEEEFYCVYCKKYFEFKEVIFEIKKVYDKFCDTCHNEDVACVCMGDGND